MGVMYQARDKHVTATLQQYEAQTFTYSQVGTFVSGIRHAAVYGAVLGPNFLGKWPPILVRGRIASLLTELPNLYVC